MNVLLEDEHGWRDRNLPELGFTADSNSMAKGREQCTVYGPCCSVPERQRRGTAHVSICQRRKLTLSWLQAPEDTVQCLSDAAITSAVDREVKTC